MADGSCTIPARIADRMYIKPRQGGISQQIHSVLIDSFSKMRPQKHSEHCWKTELRAIPKPLQLANNPNDNYRFTVCLRGPL